RPQLDDAVRDHPGVADVVARIREDADAFERIWVARQQRSRSPGAGRPARARVSRVAWRMAAAAAVVVFVGLLLYVVQRESSRLTIEVHAGAVEKIAMKDGTHVRLIGPAVLSYIPTDALPRPATVSLSGDAYFDVAGGDTPFVVTTSTARVSVLGTNFGLRASPEKTDVVLASGRLSVSGLSDDAGIVLEAGFAISVPEGGQPSLPRQVNLADALSWAGLFVFRGTAVEVIAARLSDHYGKRVEIDASLANERVSGTFESDRDLEDVLQIIATSLGASVRETGDGFRLTTGTR
ncbi:MAG: FecR domain-containing protein, partial [Rhodothermales bacterium]|nr:FecR domain-containing protein [Rhodothermales bacterium]